MINVSNAFRNELYNDNRNYLLYADITLADGTELNLNNSDFWQGGFSIEDSVSASDTFTVGGAVINKLTLVINNIYEEFSEYDFSEAEVEVKVGLKLPNGTTESFRKGLFIVDETKYNGSLITLTCLDPMSKFDRPYSESVLGYPATLMQIVQDACQICDVTLQSYSFPHDDFIVQNRPSDEATTFREVISWVAQIACCFARCDTLGRLEIKWYNTAAIEAEDGLDGGIFDSANPYASGDTADGGTFNPWSDGDEYDGGTFENQNYHHIFSNYSIDIATDDVVITGVKVTVPAESEESSNDFISYLSGSNGYVIGIEGNDLIQGEAGETVAGWLGTMLIGLRFRSGQVSHSSDPSIEAGDVAFLTTRNGSSYPFLVSYTKFGNGGSQSTESIAETPSRNSATRYSASTKNYVEFRKNLKEQKSQYDQALEALGDRIDNSSGLYTTEEIQEDGSTIFYMHDKPVLSESEIVWKMTAEAWGVSTDGGEHYNAGMTVDGDTITRILTATGINADWITTGSLRVTDSVLGQLLLANTQNGAFEVDSDYVIIGKQYSGSSGDDQALKIQVSTNYIVYVGNSSHTVNDYHNFSLAFNQKTIKIKAYIGEDDVTEECLFSYYIGTGSSVNFSTYDASRSFSLEGFYGESALITISAQYMGKMYEGYAEIHLKYIQGNTPPQGRVGRFSLYTLNLNFDEPITFYEDGTCSQETNITIRLNDNQYPGQSGSNVTVSDRAYFVAEVYYSGLYNGQTVNTNEILYESGYTYAATINIEDALSIIYKYGYIMDKIVFSAYADESHTQLLQQQTTECLLADSYSKPSDEEKFFQMSGRGQHYFDGNVVYGLYKIGKDLFGSFNIVSFKEFILDDKAVVMGTIEVHGADEGEVESKKYELNKDGVLFPLVNYGNRIDFYNSEKENTSRIANESFYSTGSGTIEGLELSSLQAMVLKLGLTRTSNPLTNDDVFIYGYYNSNGEVRTQIRNLIIDGTKSREFQTENYSDRLLYCYETPSPMFGDIGSGLIGDDGICYVPIDDIFLETISSRCKYYVFLQKEGQGDLWVDSKESTFFVVKGTPGLTFSYEIKAKQKDYETERLEINDKGHDLSKSIDYIRNAETYVNNFYKELEEIAHDEEINQLHAAYNWRG